MTRYSWRAVHTGVWDVVLEGLSLAVPPTGKPIWDRGISIFRVAEGKLIEQWVEWTKLELVQQLGMIAATEQLGEHID